MATQTPLPVEAGALAAPDVELKLRSNKLFTIVAMVAIVVGIGSALGGIAGGVYTYQQAAAENVTTPEDAVIAEAPVRGPLTMWAQSDIITHHQLDRTAGLRYSEMERMVPMVDEAGEVVLDEAGEPMMVENEARGSWLDATTLTTALGLGIMAYALSAFALVIGLTLVALGTIVLKLRHAAVSIA